MCRAVCESDVCMRALCRSDVCACGDQLVRTSDVYVRASVACSIDTTTTKVMCDARPAQTRQMDVHVSRVQRKNADAKSDRSRQRGTDAMVTLD